MSITLDRAKNFAIDVGGLVKDLQDKNNREDVRWISSADAAIKPGLMLYVSRRPAPSYKGWRIGEHYYNQNETCLVINVETVETKDSFERHILVLVGTQYETICQRHTIGPVDYDGMSNFAKVVSFVLGEKKLEKIERWSMMTVLNAELLDFLSLRKEPEKKSSL